MAKEIEQNLSFTIHVGQHRPKTATASTAANGFLSRSNFSGKTLMPLLATCLCYIGSFADSRILTPGMANII